MTSVPTGYRRVARYCHDCNFVNLMGFLSTTRPRPFFLWPLSCQHCANSILGLIPESFVSIPSDGKSSSLGYKTVLLVFGVCFLRECRLQHHCHPRKQHAHLTSLSLLHSSPTPAHPLLDCALHSFVSVGGQQLPDRPCHTQQR
jgi:hypothetical protein